MKRKGPLTLEVLEDRTAPALYGVPWSDPRHLTLSFVPDGTPIAGHTSNLFQTLDAQMPTATWEAAILQAVQTWTVNANISIGIVADGGQPFGTSGLTQGDPRFGDIRIGAQPMSPEALSVSVPHDPYLSGTWSGDVLLNSNVDFTAPSSSLYNVMLHELGHVLGLADNDDPTSALYRKATSLPEALSPSDIAALQALYGPPIDLPEVATSGGARNDTFQTATPIQSPTPGPHQSTPLVAFGALTDLGDADVFSLAAPHSEGPITFLVQTAGISLLEPNLTVYDASGNVLGQGQSTNVLGDQVTVTVSPVKGNSTYYVRVSGATQDVFSIGRFGLAVTYGEMETSPAQIAAVLRGPYDTLSADQIAELFRNPEGRFRPTAPPHNTLSTALVLTTTPGHLAYQHYEITDHLGEGIPAYYEIETPASASGAPVSLTAAVNALSYGRPAQVQVFDSLGNPLAANVLVNGGGTYTIQAELLPGQTYYLELHNVGESEYEGSGNCSLVVDFSQPLALSRKFAEGTLTQAAPQQTFALYVAQTQLFELALTVDGTSARTNSSVELTITDQAGNVVFDVVAGAGQTVSGASVLLPPGAYTARFTTKTLYGAAVPLTYHLHGSSLTDPIGPALNDPTLQPWYTQPPVGVMPPPDPTGTLIYYYYPGGVITLDPFLWAQLAL
jgi:hypothetical protein